MAAPTMSNTEAIQMMERCKHEIMQLRNEVERLRPRAEAYDNLAIVLSLLPRRSTGETEDMVWVLNKRMEELTAPVPNIVEYANVGPGGRPPDSA